MNDAQENFDSLRQLLKLKREETPPPGYFNNFSAQIIAQIRSGETAEVRTVAKNASETPWFLKFFSCLS